ncbi:suppressor of rasval19 [Microbotryomycetes sp. JL201]|nr:suppressor of rasval19 [Microbotryomycetes sp. JL201]
MPASAAPQVNTGGIPAAGIGSLSTLLRRLEAATARLEDIAMTHSTTGGPHFISGASAVQPGSAAASATAGAAAGGTATGTGTGDSAAQTPATPAVRDYDELLDGPVAKYAALSQELGGLIAEQAQHVVKTFQAQRNYIQMATQCSKPAPTELEPLLKPTQTSLMAAIDIKEKNRASKESNQLTVVAEGIPALGWVVVEPTPAPFIGEHKDSAEFWVLRVLKEHKESNPKQVEWARSFTAALVELQKYVKQHHTTGLSWNPKGVPAESYKSEATASGTSTDAPPPPPPPPPAPAAPSAPPPPPAGSSQSTATPDMGAVFSQLNQGEAITKSLRKVDKSEMTHKNPELRAAGVVGDIGGATKAPTKPPKPTSMQKKPPKTALEGKIWNIENHENNSQIIIDQTEINQAVNVYNVKSSVIQIKGKVNAVSLVNCHKTSVLLDSALASVSVSSSPSFTIQILGKVPTITVDGCDSGQIFLSKSSLDVEIVTAKTSAINVSLPVEGEDDGVFEEKAVPEQLKTVVQNGKLVTTVVEHSG